MRPSGAHTHPHEGGGGLAVLAAVVAAVIAAPLLTALITALASLLEAIAVIVIVLAAAAIITLGLLIFREMRGNQLRPPPRSYRPPVQAARTRSITASPSVPLVHLHLHAVTADESAARALAALSASRH